MTTATIKAKSDFAQLLENKPEYAKVYQVGEIISGTVTAVTKHRIWVDISDGRFVGIISNKELAEEGIVAPGGYMFVEHGNPMLLQHEFLSQNTRSSTS